MLQQTENGEDERCIDCARDGSVADEDEMEEDALTKRQTGSNEFTSRAFLNPETSGLFYTSIL